MCGLAGFIQARKCNISAARNTVREMGEALHHRGPDDAGIWAEKFGERGVAFSHARLSIVGLGPSGHQPMISNSGRFVLVFNGEIYNHMLLRKELGDRFWNGNSDTETLLACIERWGFRATIGKAHGMFALALWDRKRRKLFLARDRLGEKPLYYGWCGDVFVFGSELKALKMHPDFEGIVSRDSLALLMRHNYIPAPHSIYKGVSKLTPGSLIDIDAENTERILPEPEKYWAISNIASQSESLYPTSDAAAISHFEGTLRNVVDEQMMADVPLGAFLSGGIDSSIVVALMQSNMARKVSTFSIGFHDAKFDESRYACAVAKHLGTDHHELYVSSDDALAVIPSLPSVFDEPFADSSQIPTLLLSKLTKEFVSVALSGDGGDEILGGYSRYAKSEKMWSRLSGIPRIAKKPLSSIINSLGRSTMRKIDFVASKLSQERKVAVSNKLGLLSAALTCDENIDYYRETISYWRDPSVVVVNSDEPNTILTDRISWPDMNDFQSKMMFADIHSYLPDDILVKVDRAAMSVGLETRVPLLDSRIVELAWSLPLRMKIRNGQSKWILRKILSKHIPDELINRPKMGFAVPLADWLRGPLREWAELLLEPERLNQEGFFYPDLIRERWDDHISGIANWQSVLWPILMFQLWLEGESAPARP